MQDDVAADVQVAFEDAYADGLNVRNATRHVLDAPPWSMNDEEDACVMILALAALQLQVSALTPEVRQQALEATASEWASSQWEDAPDEQMKARRRILAQFRAILERGYCTSEEWEQVCYPKEFSVW